MKSVSTLKRGVAKARREWQAGQYEGALAEVSRLLEEWPDNPQLLVMWADLIQLQDSEERPTLDDAKAAYKRAAELDPSSPEPFLELGHFLFALEDDAKGASKAYAKAVALCRRLLQEALTGQAKALSELDRPREAFVCLREAIQLQSPLGKSGNGQGTADLLELLKEVTAQAE